MTQLRDARQGESSELGRRKLPSVVKRTKMRIDDDCIVSLSTEVKTVLYIDSTDQAATSIARQQQPSRKTTAFLSILLGHTHNTKIHGAPKHYTLNVSQIGYLISKTYGGLQSIVRPITPAISGALLKNTFLNFHA